MLIINRIYKTRVIINHLLIVGLVSSALSLVFATSSHAAPSIVFPVIGSTTYSDDFYSPRSDGPHYATDIIANKGQLVVSAAVGVIEYVAYPQPSWGYMVRVRGNDGYTYSYIHLNNDTPSTDDGKGDGFHAYGPDMVQTYPVKKGQLIGYVGDSGNAENTVSHLHFEIYQGNTPINPYPYLRAAPHLSKPALYPQLSNEILPFGNGGALPASIDIGNFDQASDKEVVVGAGAGGGPNVKVYRPQTKELVLGFFAYDPSFKGGVNVAAVDFDGDGISEILVAPGKTGGPHVKVYRKNMTLMSQFFAANSSNTNGIRVAAGDVDGDNQPDIITVPMSGENPTVRVFTLRGVQKGGFPIYTPSFTGGADVAVGDVDDDGRDEIVVSAGTTGGPHVLVYEGNGIRIGSFFAYGTSFHGGVQVSVGDVDMGHAGEEFVTSPMAQGSPIARVWTYQGNVLNERLILERWWRGGYDIAADENLTQSVSGVNRRASIRRVDL